MRARDDSPESKAQSKLDMLLEIVSLARSLSSVTVGARNLNPLQQEARDRLAIMCAQLAKDHGI